MLQAALDWLGKNHEEIVRGLADLVAIQSISTDGEHHAEIDRTAKLTCDMMRQAGLHNVETLRVGGSLPYAYGEWLDAPGKPTVFLYAHHDVQPVNFVEQWQSDPWKLTRRDGRLFARGSADDKGAISAMLGAIAAYRKTGNNLPVNVKVLVEGEEEIGSKYLLKFFEAHKERIKSDVVVVCDTENVEVGIPSLTYSLRGIVGVQVDVSTAKTPAHSGMAGGALPDAAVALNAILGRLYWGNGPVPVPGLYDQVRPLTDKERAAFGKLPFDPDKFRNGVGMVPTARLALEEGYNAYAQTWRRPAVTVIAQEASSIKGASNQVLPRASALVSCRIVPDQKPEKVLADLTAFLTKDPPWGCEVKVTPAGPPVDWWMTDPNGPAFEAALAAMRGGFDRDPVAIGCGGSIGFVGPLSELFGGAPALLMGIEDPASNAHAPNESLHEGDFKKLMASLVRLFDNLGKLPPNRVK
ncbi:peptidase m20 : Peptidase M20 OS=uncultured planctomycete GN=HGMM_F07G10C22 PE=4 SV=1: Peptidase_M20: M20_dimer [Gemmataceae bacterium]|nr:peptidase m20 : Peptidase M20 OS=uncultured planctomycete GN=HGMM_F07G10C22 PE=4 SV=1: Peptidase_M20: M20_dimer [Gemmataceae bacterium]VTT98472.1 peptidase m20 : Peptidase M20 OS=uncultured planctomycete GN=HGMM_F07G10C22 PE=4 SV=1: Peptidase_M20: M20_dimer [Gemmataceae bacterium]